MATTRSRASNPARSTAARHTSEYHLPVTRTWRGANYAYPRGVGGDRGKRPSYPLRPKRRAQAARTYAARKDTAGSLSHVDTAIRHIYGSVGAIYSGRGGSRGRGAGRGAPAARGASVSRGRGSTRATARSRSTYHHR